MTTFRTTTINARSFSIEKIDDIDRATEYCRVSNVPEKGAVGTNGLKGAWLVIGGHLDGARFLRAADAFEAVGAH